MKRKLFLVFILVLCFIGSIVFAESKDIEAKYEVNYNVNLVKVQLNNNSKNISFDDYSFEVSTSMNDIEVVIIKTTEEAIDYVEGFSSSDESYYLIINQNEKKIESSDINIKINSSNKVLSVYKNTGKLLDKSNENINLTNNDYFLVITDKIDIDNNDYVITSDGNKVINVVDIEVNDDSKVEVYNSKDVKVDNKSILGTNYKVVVKNENDTTTYVVIVKGDTTGDAKINLNDITRLYHNYKGIEDMENPYILAGDVASNDIINLNDVTKLYHYYKNIITEL